MTITEIKAYCEEKSLELKNKIELLSQSRDTVKAVKEKHEKEMQKAYEKNDPEKFIASQSEYTKAEQSEQFYTRKISDLESAPLFRLEEYNRLVSNIRSDLDQRNEEDAKKILNYVDKIYMIGIENAKAIEEGNSLLHHMQFDLMHDDISIRESHGHGFPAGYYKDEYRDEKISGITNHISDYVSFLRHKD